MTVLVSLSAIHASNTTPARESYNFNTNWRLWVGDDATASGPDFKDIDWKRVTLPRAWNEDDAFRVSINKMPTGIAWYRKTFRLPPNTTGQKFFLEFEGVHQAAEVWLNGKLLGLHENGITAFGFDITDLAKQAPQDNIIAVRTDNSYNYKERATNTAFQWNHTSFNVAYGGLTKNVRLHVTGKLYQTLPLYTNLGTTGVYVYASNFDIPGRAATIHIESEVVNETGEEQNFTLQVDLTDLDGKTVAHFQSAPVTLAAGKRDVVKAAQRVQGLQFWSWGYGYLYNVVTTIVADGKQVDAVTTRTGFRKTEFGNGMVKLNDRAMHLKGYAQRSSNEWPSLGSSAPPWLSDYSNRMMVESNANIVRWMHISPSRQDIESCDRIGLLQQLPAGDAERDVSGRQWQQRLEAMRDTTIYNRNSPSVLVYEAGNKGVSEAHMRDIKGIRDKYDPMGGRASGSREMLDSKEAEWGGEMLYINKSGRQPFWATEYSRDEGLRKYWDAFTPPFHAAKGEWDHNQDTHAIENVRRWYDYWRERPGTGTRVNAGGLNIVFSDSNTHYRGRSNFRTSGEVDAMRTPKDGFWAHQIMWNGWVEIEQVGIRILGHWNYEMKVKKDVYVISSADQVELILNGISLGKGDQTYRFLHTFKDVTWQSGELRAVGKDSAGKILCEHTLRTVGEPSALRLTSVKRPFPIRADGADVALVEVEVVDAHGMRCPTALNIVDFELSGPGEWRGGLAQGPNNYVLSKSLPVECGVNRVIIRAGTDPGKIILRATSGSLAPATIVVDSESIAASGGLAIRLPSDGLPTYMERGPTPPGKSFEPSRIAIAVAKVSAADAGDAAALAVDDNERTTWIGKGPITFELSRPAKVSAITAKFAGWRSRSYSIRITTDGQEVYQGQTPVGLGYVTLPLKPVLGRTIEISLIGSLENKDAFEGVTELEDKKNADTGADKVPPQNLGIVEIEFYESTKTSAP